MKGSIATSVEQGTLPSNISYAHQWMTGKRKDIRWSRSTVDSNVAQMSNRGPQGWQHTPR